MEKGDILAMGDSLRLFVQRITKLPTLPVIAHEILQLTGDDLVSVGGLTDIVEKDPAISSKVLSLADSAFFGYKTRSTTVDSAIHKIGIDNVRNIALGISLMTIFGHGGHEHALDYRRIYRHSMAAGMIAKMLSENLGMKNPDRNFLCGMLHDMGLLLLNRYFPDIYKQVVDEVKSGSPLLEAETKVLGFIHADVGAWLADKWNLPDDIHETVQHHHSPSAGRRLPHVAVVRLADYLSCKKLFFPGRKDPGYTIEPSSLAVLNITEKDIGSMESMISDELFAGGVFRP